jgi:DNA repair protein RecO
MSSYKNTLGIVINKKNIGDNDLLITFLTPSYGKIVSMAKGAHKINSRRLGHLQLGNIVKATFFEKNNRLWLSETTNIESFMLSPKNLIQLNLLFLFLEFINQLIPENQHTPEVYKICKNIINSIKNNKFKSYIYYEIQLIKVLGFGISQEISTSYKEKDYVLTQKLLKSFFESLIERPIQSNKLFT